MKSKIASKSKRKVKSKASGIGSSLFFIGASRSYIGGLTPEPQLM